MEDIKEFIQQRDAALAALDINYARRKFPDADDATLLLSLHKARVEAKSLPETLRRESMAWLKERGYGRMMQLPWPPNEELPE